MCSKKPTSRVQATDSYETYNDSTDQMVSVDNTLYNSMDVVEQESSEEDNDYAAVDNVPVSSTGPVMLYRVLYDYTAKPGVSTCCMFSFIKCMLSNFKPKSKVICYPATQCWCVF